MRYFNKITYCVLAVMVFSCKTTNKISNSDFGFLYKKEYFPLHPKYTVHHTSTENSIMYFSIESKELLYAKQLNENDFKARMELGYLVVQASDTRITVDSGTVQVTDINNDNTEKIISGNVKIKLPAGKKYTFSLVFNDMNKKTYSETLIDIDKTTNAGAFNYLVSRKDGSIPVFKNYLQPLEEVLITYSQPLKNIRVKYYKKDFILPAPPFSITDVRPLGFTADSIFFLQGSPDGTVEFQPAKEGMYFFQADTNTKEGLTLYCYYNGFPYVSQPDQLLDPLRYLTAKSEFDDMNSSANRKLAVETFWINCTGNKDRAREVIKKFYTRVADANLFFSSYLEGWKTDRGMIYIVYGPANYIYKNSGGETWLYGDPNNINALQFNFSKVENTFSDNDFTLERSVIYKSSWYRAIDIWRQGRIYLQN